jgi:ubiquitin carboxyl-terminal hydrolase L3
MKQYAENACGTIAVIHSIMNNLDEVPFLVRPGSFLENFRNEMKGKSPEEIGKYVLHNKKMQESHKDAVHQGETKIEEQVNYHFISLVEKDGFLYELDGCKEFPVNHGPCLRETFLADACRVVEKFMFLDPSEIRFTMMALANSNTD